MLAPRLPSLIGALLSAGTATYGVMAPPDINAIQGIFAQIQGQMGSGGKASSGMRTETTDFGVTIHRPGKSSNGHISLAEIGGSRCAAGAAKGPCPQSVDPAVTRDLSKVILGQK